MIVFLEIGIWKQQRKHAWKHCADFTSISDSKIETWEFYKQEVKAAIVWVYLPSRSRVLEPVFTPDLFEHEKLCFSQLVELRLF